MADVAGKGIPAALIMATFRALLRTSVRGTPPLSHVVQQVNELLVESIGLPAFVTAVYGVLEPAAGRFSYANCGHNCLRSCSMRMARQRICTAAAPASACSPA